MLLFGFINIPTTTTPNNARLPLKCMALLMGGTSDELGELVQIKIKGDDDEDDVAGDVLDFKPEGLV